jgi:hypothetical protein
MLLRILSKLGELVCAGGVAGGCGVLTDGVTVIVLTMFRGFSTEGVMVMVLTSS